MSTPITPPPAGPAAPLPRVPPEAEFAFPGGLKRTLQVNFCKNPRCLNFGIPPTSAKYARRATAAPGPGIEYRMAASGAGLPQLKCLLCGEHLPVKSNLGVAEELKRLTAHFAQKEHCCPAAGCVNQNVAVPNPGSYHAFGKTESGSVRYRCKACKKTFSVASRSTLRQREPRKNVPILQHLMNKAPLSRLVEVHGISFQTLYDKLDFFKKQALGFAAKYEQRLPELVDGTKRYIAVDRQDYAVNWTHRKDKRNVVLRAIGSADLASGYVFGMNINFDGSLDAEAVEKEAVAIGDYAIPAPFRRHGRLWLQPDYTRAVAESAARLVKRMRGGGTTLGDSIRKSYDEAEKRDDVESADLISKEERFPANGMQVRNEYTMYAHFYYLHHLLGTADKLRFFMDQESGIRAACLAAFENEVRERKADAFFVRLSKELTVDQKRKLVGKSRDLYQAARDANPGLTEYEVQVLMMKHQIAAAASIGKWSDRWAAHPFPNNAEPEKAICYLTDFDDYDEDHKARLYLKASLHAIDRFFMAIRRRLNMLERPISTSSTAGRTWYGYSAYQPDNIEKLLAVFRTYYNFCLVGQDDRTPAMRIGLVDRPIKPAELLGM